MTMVAFLIFPPRPPYVRPPVLRDPSEERRGDQENKDDMLPDVYRALEVVELEC